MTQRAWMLACVSATILTVAALAAQTPVGTTFSYQGRLTDGGIPANGAYDLQFTLFDADTGGVQVGIPLTKTNVPVSGGIFSVLLDFGGGIFTGNARWLAIGVRPGGTGGAFTAIAPRQQLTPAPNALYSVVAGTITGSVLSSQINGLVAIANGGTQAATAAQARTNLGIQTISATAPLALSASVLSFAPSGPVDLNSQKITNLAAPTASSDAASKAYVDAYVADLADRVTALETAVASLEAAVAVLEDAVAAGSSNYIQNGTTAQTASFNITGNATIGGALRVPNFSTAPGAPTAGQLYFDTTLNSLRVYDGTAWTSLTP